MARKSGVYGDKALMSTLRQMPGTIGVKYVDQIAVRSLEPMKDATIANARLLRDPENPNPKGGHLDQGIVTRRIEARGKTRRVYWISFIKRARYIAHLVEFGTRAHWQPRRFGGWMHPGARRKPFFRPAFEQNKKRTMDDFGRGIWQAMKSITLGAVKRRP